MEKLKLIKNVCNNCRNTIISHLNIQFCLTCNSESLLNNELNCPIEDVKPRCLIITKSDGELDPLKYSNKDLLHIGISNSKKVIYNFWFEYKKDKCIGIWKRIINIEMDLNISDDDFDNLLEKNLKIQIQKNSKYDQFNNNCFDYICRFLNYINYRNNLWDKESLANKIIQEHVINLEKYCIITKKLFTEGIVIYLEELKYTSFICDICEDRIIYGERNKCLICKDYDLCDNCFIKKGHEHEMIKY